MLNGNPCLIWMQQMLPVPISSRYLQNVTVSFFSVKSRNELSRRGPFSPSILSWRTTRGAGSKTGSPSRTLSFSIRPKFTRCISSSRRSRAGDNDIFLPDLQPFVRRSGARRKGILSSHGFYVQPTSHWNGPARQRGGVVPLPRRPGKATPHSIYGDLSGGNSLRLHPVLT